MQRMEETAIRGGAGLTQVEVLVEKHVKPGYRGESIAEVAHDARNMVTALAEVRHH